jgi:hypothetical protein
MMEAVRTSEMPVYFNKATHHYILEGHHLDLLPPSSGLILKLQSVSSRLHGTISQKMVNFMFIKLIMPVF